MITTAAWVPRGFAAPFPSKYTFDQDEFERIAELAKLQLDDAKEDLEEAAEEEQEEQEEAQEGGAGVKKDRSKKKEKKAKKEKGAAEEDDDDNEYVQDTGNSILQRKTF